MNTNGLTNVEQSFFNRSGRKVWSTKVPFVIVQNFPDLGLLTSLRFLEWVAENPEGVISLPTGKTPEYFIRWTKQLLSGWDKPENRRLMEKNGLISSVKPSLKGLHFVQIDDFYPINPKQHNSFFDYVRNFYIKEFELDPSKALLINADEIPLDKGKHYSEVFPDNCISVDI